MCCFWKSRTKDQSISDKTKSEDTNTDTDADKDLGICPLDGTIDGRIEVKSGADMSPAEITQALQVIYECFIKPSGIDPNCPEFDYNNWKYVYDQLYLFKVNDVIVGLAEYVSYKWSKENIMSLCVYENYRRRGIASIILKKIISDHSCDKDLVLLVDSHPNAQILIKFYQKHGFILDPKRTEEDEYRLYMLRKPHKRRSRKSRKPRRTAL